MQKFPSVFPKRFSPVSLRMHNKSAQRKPAKHKKTSCGKNSKQDLSVVPKTYNKKETFWRPIKAYNSLKLLLFPSLTICLDREQFVLVAASVYNKIFITQSVTKREFPKYQPSQNSTYQVVSLKKEINKKLFPKADSLADKILSCPRIKLSNSQTLILDGKETGIFLSQFAQQLRRKIADVPDIYFTLIDAAGKSLTLIVNQIAKAKERGSWVPFKL